METPAPIDIRPLDTVEAVFAASDVLSEVWGGDRTGMPANLLRALAHAGNYAFGAYDGEQMVGASVAFFGPPSARTLHSHITGLLPPHRGHGEGRALKLHQREWAIAHGAERITWTFDPLVARNAHFNIRVLGARVVEYLVDHYGPMDDGVNRGDESDRLLVSWDLISPPPARATAEKSPAEMSPADQPPAEETLAERMGAERMSAERVIAAVAVPRDIESIRASGGDALAWRRRVREEMLRQFADGLVVGGFDDERGYLFVRPQAP